MLLWLCLWAFCIASIAFALMTLTSSSAATVGIIIVIWCLQFILCIHSIIALLAIGVTALIMGQKFLNLYNNFK